MTRKNLGGRSDFHEAVEISRAMHWRPTDKVVEAHISYTAERVRAEYLETQWDKVQRIAAELVAKKRLSGDDVARICSRSAAGNEEAA